MRLSCLTAILATAVGLAQSPLNGVATEFEVASIKLQKGPVGGLPVMKGGPGTTSPGRVRYSNVSLMSLIIKAYGVYADQVLGPPWLTSDRYTIDAIVPSGVTKEEQFRRMLQNLLIRRFKLTVQWEEKDFMGYQLVIASGGPKLRVSAAIDEGEDDGDALASDPNMSAKPKELDGHGCPVISATRHGSMGNVGGSNCTTFVGYSIPELVNTLEMMVGFETGAYLGPSRSKAHIIDRTGLSGRFDFNLEYSVLYHLTRASGSQFPSGENDRYSSSSSIFKAVETQLGLKLEPMKSRLKVMVIQQVEKTPTEN